MIDLVDLFVRTRKVYPSLAFLEFTEALEELGGVATESISCDEVIRANRLVRLLPFRKIRKLEGGEKYE